MLALEDLLLPYGLDLRRDGAKVKLVRHQDKRFDVAAMYQRGADFEVYQAFQSRPRFDCEWIVSFLGQPGTLAVFVGMYRVGAMHAAGTRQLPPGFLYPALDVSTHVYYELEKDPRFSDLEGRLVIEWGKGALAWVQNFRPSSKLVVELLPVGYVKPFPGYLNVRLMFDELVEIVRNPTANREWHARLAAVAGVYLILDTATGAQYVGSAYGQEGLLGRWRTYAKGGGHGGNRQLKEIAEADGSSVKSFQFSILQTLDRALTKQEVIDAEVSHKLKLGSRAHGLNSN